MGSKQDKTCESCDWHDSGDCWRGREPFEVNKGDLFWDVNEKEAPEITPEDRADHWLPACRHWEKRKENHTSRIVDRRKY